MTYGYRIGENQSNDLATFKIREYIEKYKTKEYKETPLMDNFIDIA